MLKKAGEYDPCWVVVDEPSIKTTTLNIEGILQFDETSCEVEATTILVPVRIANCIKQECSVCDPQTEIF